MDPRDILQVEAGDDVDRAIRRAAAEKRSDRFYIGGTALGAALAIIGAIITVKGGPPWVFGAGFGLGVVVAATFAILGRQQLDYEPTGEIEPPPPEGPPPDTDKVVEATKPPEEKQPDEKPPGAKNE